MISLTTKQVQVITSADARTEQNAKTGAKQKAFRVIDQCISHSEVFSTLCLASCFASHLEPFVLATQMKQLGMER